MLKIKLLLEKQENILKEKQAEEKRIKEEKENAEQKKNLLFLNNEFKISHNTEVPTDDQINDLTKYNFQKNSTNLQTMGFNFNNNLIIATKANEHTKSNQNGIDAYYNKDNTNNRKANQIKYEENIDFQFNDKDKKTKSTRKDYTGNKYINNYVNAKINVGSNINSNLNNNNNNNYLNAISTGKETQSIINNKSSLKTDNKNNNHAIKSANTVSNTVTSPIISHNATNNINKSNTNIISKRASRRFLKSNSNSLNIKNTDKEFKCNINAIASAAAEDFLDTSSIINKLFADKKESIDFSLNSFKIEKDFLAGGIGKTSNNLKYVNKPRKFSGNKASKGKEALISQTNFIKSKEAKAIVNFNSTKDKENSNKEKIYNKDINKDYLKNSTALRKNLSSGLIKKPKTAEFFLKNEIKKETEKEDLKAKITPYTSGFNSKLFTTSIANNSKSTYNLIDKKDATKPQNNNNKNNNLSSNLAKNENSFSPTYKLRKEYSEINSDKIRKLISDSQEKNLKRENTSRNKSKSKEKNGFFDSKNNLSAKNQDKEDLKNKKSKLERKSDVMNTEKFFSSQNDNSKNPFNFSSNLYSEGKNEKLKEKQSSKKALTKTKSKIVMIDLNADKNVTCEKQINDVNLHLKNENEKKSLNKKDKEAQKDLVAIEYNLNKNCNDYLSPEKNHNKSLTGIKANKTINNTTISNKINSLNLNSRSITMSQELNFLKSESKNSFNNANRNFANEKSKVFLGASDNIDQNINNNDFNCHANVQFDLQHSNTLNLQDYSINPEMKIYKSNKIKRVLKKNDNENEDLKLICSLAAEKINNIVCLEKAIKNKIDSDGGNELEEHEINLNRSGSDGRIGNNRYSIVNNIHEKLTDVNNNKSINNNNQINENNYNKLNKCEINNKNIDRNDISFKINLKDLQENPKNLNNSNYLKLKEYTIKKVNTNLYEEKEDLYNNSHRLRYSRESLNHPNQDINKEKDLCNYNYNYQNNKNKKSSSSNNNTCIKNNLEAKNTKSTADMAYSKKKNSYNNEILLDKNSENMNIYCQKINNKSSNNRKGSLNDFSAGGTSSRLTDAREKRFSKRFSTEHNNIQPASNSLERNSDINKINQKLNDVCHNLALFKIKSDSLRNSTNIDNNAINSHIRKESSDFEFNLKSNLINTDNTLSDNHNHGVIKRERFNALRSSDPINYSNNNKLNFKFVKQVILSHRSESCRNEGQVTKDNSDFSGSANRFSIRSERLIDKIRNKIREDSTQKNLNN